VKEKPFSIPRSLLGRIPRRRNLSTLMNMSIAVVGMTTLLLMVQISGVASKAYEVQRLEDQRTYWQETNFRVEAEIARLGSLSYVRQEAANRLKMAPAQNVIPVPLPNTAQNRAASQETTKQEPAAPTRINARTWLEDMADLAKQIWENR
jgi:hypothetical protein